MSRMEIRIEPVPAAQKSVLRQMLELYLYDFSEFSKEDLAENGYFGYTYLDAYWQEAGRFPFFIRADGRLAGAAIIGNLFRIQELKDMINKGRNEK